MERKKYFVFIVAIICVLFHSAWGNAEDNNTDFLVILHTNDTHSRIDPDVDGLGGIARRQVVIDSIREIYPNVMLVDAGDAVQGTLYYTLFGGEVERVLMNELGYDIQILGNHEFDGGMDNLVREWDKLNATKISTNYDLSDTPLDSIIQPYFIKQIGNRKIAFIAINLDPEGIIFAGSSEGVRYKDGLHEADSIADYLKNEEKVDFIVAITHIGYSVGTGYGDVDLASKSRNIDIIIGGHTHTLINPSDTSSVPPFMVNELGDTVLIAQAGFGGKYIGEIVIELNTLRAHSDIIRIDGRLDDRLSNKTVGIINNYRNEVDSMLNEKISWTAEPLKKDDWTLTNFISDILYEEGTFLSGGKIDLAIMNRGGIRCDLPEGDISKGIIMQMLPFDNKIVILELCGKELKEAIEVMAKRGGDGISKNVFSSLSDEKELLFVMINDEEIDENRIYTIATVDYLAYGGDYMAPLKNGKIIARSNNMLYKDVVRNLSDNFNAGKKIVPDRHIRMPINGNK